MHRLLPKLDTTPNKLDTTPGRYALFLITSLFIFIPLLFFRSLALASPPSPHRFDAEINVLGQYNAGETGQTDQSWLQGGLGRYTLNSDDKLSALGEFHLGYHYTLNDDFKFSTHLQARDTTRSDSARAFGVVELKGRYQTDINFQHSLRFTFGQFFLPISMENTERFWESPYTLSFSSLNSWIGEEFRPIGFDASHRYHFNDGTEWETAVTLFGGNDSMGAILAYRGWSYGRHRTVFGDVLAIPELASLEDGGTFEGQRDDGSKPFGRELDDRPGYALRTSVTGDDYIVSLAWVDNQGDTELHHGEYAWRTKFAVLGGSWLVTDELELISEASYGNTTMGAAPGVDADFYSAYLMASYLKEEIRYSVRYDLFGMDDLDDMDDDNNDLGRSLTLAVMWQPEEASINLGAEVLYLNSKRTKVTTSGQFDEADSLSVSFLLKYHF